MRLVSEFYIINEELIGLFCGDKTDADTLVMILKTFLFDALYLFLNVMGKHTIWLDNSMACQQNYIEKNQKLCLFIALPTQSTYIYRIALTLNP